MILRDYNNYSKYIDFDISTFSFVVLSELPKADDVQGVFCDVGSKKIYVYVFEGGIKIAYNNIIWSINDVCEYSLDKKEAKLTLRNDIDKSNSVRMKIKDFEMLEDFTQTDEEDFNFLLWLFNISKSKERQEIIISSYQGI